MRYTADHYVKIYFNEKTHIHALEGTRTACNTALTANPDLRSCIARIVFLEKPGWKKVA